MHEFKTYLPVQLDGTCNGFQHLALLSNETRLLAPKALTENLNLAKANKEDRPKDFYESVVNQLNIYIDNLEVEYEDKVKNLSENNISLTQDQMNNITVYNEKIESCSRLLQLNLNRSNIKTAIMTIPYNATNTTLVNYILKSLEYSHGHNYTKLNNKGDIENRYLGWYINHIIPPYFIEARK